MQERMLRLASDFGASLDGLGRRGPRAPREPKSEAQLQRKALEVAARCCEELGAWGLVEDAELLELVARGDGFDELAAALGEVAEGLERAQRIARHSQASVARLEAELGAEDLAGAGEEHPERRAG
ncbi:MAG: hypothetical protein AB7N76_09600 [Planctomycetota bacterium]